MTGVQTCALPISERGDTPIKEHLLVTRYVPSRVSNGDMMSAEDVQEILAVPLLGVVPESPDILRASNSGVPITLDEKSEAGQAYQDAVARFLGENRPMRFLNVKKHFFSRWFGG